MEKGEIVVLLPYASTILVQHGLQEKHPPDFLQWSLHSTTHPRHKFFKSINTLVDCQPIAKELDKIYTRGRNKGGQRAYRGILLFKMLLIGIWYNLSDEQTQDMALDSLSAMDFCGLKLEDHVPDDSTLSRFRSELAAKKAFGRMLKKLNAQLKDKGIMVHSGKAKVDATISQSPPTPKGRKTYQVAQDSFEQDRSQEQQEREAHQMKLIEVEQAGVHAQGRWLKKSGKLYYGYKPHIAVDADGLIEGVHTTAANEHESKGVTPAAETTAWGKEKGSMVFLLIWTQGV